MWFVVLVSSPPVINCFLARCRNTVNPFHGIAGENKEDDDNHIQSYYPVTAVVVVGVVESRL